MKIGDKVTIEFKLARIDKMGLPYILVPTIKGVTPGIALSQAEMNNVLRAQPKPATKKPSPKKKAGKK